MPENHLASPNSLGALFVTAAGKPVGWGGRRQVVRHV